MIARLFCFIICFTTLNVVGQDIVVQPLKLLPGSDNAMAPYVVDSMLYFSSDRKVDLFVNYLDQDNNRFYKLYRVPLKSRQPSGLPELLFSGVNPFHQTALTKRPGDGSLFLTQSMYTSVQRAKQANRPNPFTIVQLASNGKSVGRSKPLALNITRGNNMAYPAFSNDGETILFVSDMPGGFGGSDLYYARKTDNGWGDPINAGSVINTPGNEGFPFVAASGKIYFASSGRHDSQGMDLYHTFLTDRGFTEPMRLDSPFNTEHDDFGLYISDDEQWGYLCSNREGRDRIYYFESLFPTFPVAEPFEEDSYCFSFYESSTENYDTLQFGFRWHFSDGNTRQGVEVDHCFPGSGSYKVSLDVYDRVSGEELFTVSDFDMDLVPKEQVRITLPQIVKRGEPIHLQADASSIGDFYPVDYYWQIGSDVKLKGQVVSYVFPRADTYVIRCGVVDEHDPNRKICTFREIVVVD